eukprot:gene10116-10999_t
MLSWKDYFTDSAAERLQIKYPESVKLFLLEYDLILYLVGSGVQLFFNIPHDYHCRMWTPGFNYVDNPMTCALDNLNDLYDRYGSGVEFRLWNFDYPYEEGNCASSGCGVSVFVIATSAAIFKLMSRDIAFCTVREVIRPEFNGYPTGYTRYYVDWDEPIPEGKSVSSNYLVERICWLLQHFRSLFKLQHDFHILPAYTSRPDKISIHAIFAGLCFRSKEEFRLFDKLFIETSEEKYKSFIDDANQSKRPLAGPCLAFLRTVGSRKALKKGILHPIRYHEDKVTGECTIANYECFSQDVFNNHLVWSFETRGDIVFEEEFEKL